MTEADFRSDSSLYNSQTDRAQGIQEAFNASRNLPHTIEGIKAGRIRGIEAEPKVQGDPCLIIGSGASLDEALPHLKGWKGGIICTSSQALSLVRYGAPPTHILALDPFCTMDEVAGVDWTRYGTKLVTTPTIWPSLYQGWPNEVLLYRQNNGRKDSFYSTTLNWMYSERFVSNLTLREGRFEPMIRTEVTLFACSPPCQLFVAQVLGYGNIFLVGCDFSYTYGKERFSEWTVTKPERVLDSFGNAPPRVLPAEWEQHVHPLTLDPKEEHLYTTTGIPTHPVHLYYKKNMLSAWRLSLQDIWITDKQGAITELPFVPIKHVVKKGGRHLKGLQPQEKKRIAEEYLASVGAFVIETDHGMSFVEAPNPEVDLTSFMTSMNRHYSCPVCKSVLQSNTDEDQTGQACPACKTGKIVRGTYSDIGANMDRIRQRLKAAARLRGMVATKGS